MRVQFALAICIYSSRNGRASRHEREKHFRPALGLRLADHVPLVQVPPLEPKRCRPRAQLRRWQREERAAARDARREPAARLRSERGHVQDLRDRLRRHLKIMAACGRVGRVGRAALRARFVHVGVGARKADGPLDETLHMAVHQLDLGYPCRLDPQVVDPLPQQLGDVARVRVCSERSRSKQKAPRKGERGSVGGCTSCGGAGSRDGAPSLYAP
mmetsp:Transcript_89578/g.255856  ORF Transcript_89578/g.255856 Transcript_89578/m.255856 type:complete len:215 (-) Transcript_89578:945-1589(-)